MIDWPGFLLAVTLVSLIPGASQLLGLRNAVRHGAGRALLGVCGRLAAFVVLIGLVVVGLGAVLAASATALSVIKWAGVVYLAWLGVQSLRSGLRPAGPETQDSARSARSTWQIVATEFAVAISNPKALLLFAALLPQFADTAAPGAGQRLAALGATYLLVELIVGLGYISVGRRAGAIGMSARAQRRLDLGTGATFIGMAGLLAVDDLS